VVDRSTDVSSNSDLLLQLEDAQEALQNLRFQKSMQQLEDLSQIQKMRKKIARLKTFIIQQRDKK
tara:strand:- start:24 stop:218 length:195 start_codon:yes stop_codon:yes gene_type:complete